MRSLILCFLVACGSDATMSAPQEPTKVSEPSAISDNPSTPDRKCRSINAVIDGQIIYVPTPCAPNHIDVDGDPVLDRGEADPRKGIALDMNVSHP